MSYNGWSNRETWLVNLHFELNSKTDLIMAKETIEEWFDKLADPSREGYNAFIWDYIDPSLIDWRELEEALPSELEE